MKTKTLPVLLIFLLAAGALVLTGQQNPDYRGNIVKGEKPVIAVPDFRGSGDAQKLMTAFNDTLWKELDDSGILKMAAKAFYPVDVPQRPEDFKPPVTTLPVRRGDQPQAV